MKYLKSGVWIVLFAAIIGVGAYYEFRAAQGLNVLGLFQGSDAHSEFVPLDLPQNGRFLRPDEKLMSYEDAVESVDVKPAKFRKLAPHLTNVRSVGDVGIVRHAGELEGVTFFAMEDIQLTHDCGRVHGSRTAELRPEGMTVEYPAASRGDYVVHALLCIVALFIAGALLFVVCCIAYGILLCWWQPIEIRDGKIVFV